MGARTYLPISVGGFSLPLHPRAMAHVCLAANLHQQLNLSRFPDPLLAGFVLNFQSFEAFPESSYY